MNPLYIARNFLRRACYKKACRLVSRSGVVRRANLEWRKAPHSEYWAHAGGGRFHLYGNSQESFDDAIKRGFSVLEADVSMTADNIPVMSHRFRPNNEVEFDAIPTVAEFLSRKINGQYTPMTLDDFISRYSKTGLYVALDPSPALRKQFGADYVLNYVKRTANEKFSRHVIYQLSGVQDLVRFIDIDWVGAFHYNLDFDLSEDANIWRIDALIPALRSLGIGSVSYVDMPVTAALESAVSRFSASDILVSVASVNSEARFRRLQEIGVSCIDTDYLYPRKP